MRILNERSMHAWLLVLFFLYSKRGLKRPLRSALAKPSAGKVSV